MQVVFNYNNGRTSQMQERYAKILKKLGRGTYGPVEVEQAQPIEVLEVEQLRAEADRRGIEYHHRAGAAKLRELLGE